MKTSLRGIAVFRLHGQKPAADPVHPEIQQGCFFKGPTGGLRAVQAEIPLSGTKEPGRVHRAVWSPVFLHSVLLPQTIITYSCLHHTTVMPGVYSMFSGVTSRSAQPEFEFYFEKVKVKIVFFLLKLQD